MWSSSLLIIFSASLGVWKPDFCIIYYAALTSSLMMVFCTSRRLGPFLGYWLYISLSLAMMSTGMSCTQLLLSRCPAFSINTLDAMLPANHTFKTLFPLYFSNNPVFIGIFRSMRLFEANTCHQYIFLSNISIASIHDIEIVTYQ